MSQLVRQQQPVSQDTPIAQTVLIYDTARLSRVEISQTVTALHDLSANNQRVIASSGQIVSPLPGTRLYEYSVGFPDIDAAQAFGKQAVQMLTRQGLPAVAATVASNDYKEPVRHLDALARTEALKAFSSALSR